MDSEEEYLRLVWICHFSSVEVRAKLRLSKYALINDFAPWIPAAISGFESMNDPKLDLHIIAPHTGMRSLICSFKLRSTTYHFFNAAIPLIHRRWWKFPVVFRRPLFKQYWLNRLLIQKFVDKIKPDIITLWGAENPYYSISALDLFHKYPVIVLLQGIYSDPSAQETYETYTTYDHSRASLERKIHASCKYFGSAVQYMTDLVLKDNQHATIFNIGVTRTVHRSLNISEDQKEFDIVFFARLTKLKGIEELLKATKIVKLSKHNVLLCIIGPQDNQEYVQYIRTLIEDLGIKENVKMLGSIQDQKDLHAEVSKARISVLPTYKDGMPNTITESIYLGIPVISCNTGLIPSLNEGDERIIILERGDISGLAQKILLLLENPGLREQYAEKARRYLIEKYDNKAEAKRMLRIYQEILWLEKAKK